MNNFCLECGASYQGYASKCPACRQVEATKSLRKSTIDSENESYEFRRKFDSLEEETFRLRQQLNDSLQLLDLAAQENKSSVVMSDASVDPWPKISAEFLTPEISENSNVISNTIVLGTPIRVPKYEEIYSYLSTIKSIDSIDCYKSSRKVISHMLLNDSNREKDIKYMNSIREWISSSSGIAWHKYVTSKENIGQFAFQNQHTLDANIVYEILDWNKRFKESFPEEYQRFSEFQDIALCKYYFLADVHRWYERQISDIDSLFVDQTKWEWWRNINSTKKIRLIMGALLVVLGVIGYYTLSWILDTITLSMSPLLWLLLIIIIKIWVDQDS
jgi:hypothetical protein